MDVVDEMGRSVVGAGDVDEPLRVRRVRRADDEQEVDLAHELLHRPLPVRGRVTDVLARRTLDVREAASEHRDDHVRLVDRERRLCDVCKRPALRERDALRVLHGLDEDDRLRRLAERPLDLLVTLVPDQDDRVALRSEPLGLHVDLRHQRAGGVYGPQPAIARPGVDARLVRQLRMRSSRKHTSDNRFASQRRQNHRCEAGE